MRLSSRLGLRLLLAIVATMLSVGVASASAASSIEGIWSFGGGRDRRPPRTERDARRHGRRCDHVRRMPAPGRRRNLERNARTARRLLLGLSPVVLRRHVRAEPDARTDGVARLGSARWIEELRVCFSHPGDVQPMIPAVGPEVDVTYGCVDSALTAPLPSVSRRLLHRREAMRQRTPLHHPPRRAPVRPVQERSRIAQRPPHQDEARRALRRRHDQPQGAAAGGFTLKIAATTILGLHLSGSRTYRTCAAQPIRRKPARLKEHGKAKRR